MARLDSLTKMNITRLAALLLVASSVAAAQGVRGTVSDSATQRPLAGAVVALLDAAGGSVARAITNERGEYRLTSSNNARTLRVVRIGFRPSTIPFSGSATMNIVMTPIPPLLDKVEIEAAENCPRRNDRVAALSLLQQARAGLLAAIVAREANPATMVRLTYVRNMEGTSDRIRHQQVHVDSAGQVQRSYVAVRDGAGFVKNGFLMDSASTTLYLGPDEQTLLDDGFSAGYCFHIADHERDRPTQVGLAFEPSSRERGRVDVEGTLWIDTLARALRNIEFRYRGLANEMNAVRAGGNIGFREMPNGMVFIDRWYLRLPVEAADTSYAPAFAGRARVRKWYEIRESGGEVASAAWPDGLRWTASLGALRAQAFDYRSNLARGVVVRLDDTDYRTTPSIRGTMEMQWLLPGPYTVVVEDSLLERLGITVPTSLRFVADRDSLTQRSFTIPQDDEFVRNRCIDPTGADDRLPTVIITVTTPDGHPVKGAFVKMVRDAGVDWQVATETRQTDEHGQFVSCLRNRRGDSFRLYVWRANEEPQFSVGHVNNSKDNKLIIELPQRP
jgi:hypothetical protein